MNQNQSKSIPENFSVANYSLDTFFVHQQPEFPAPTCIPNIFLSNKRKAMEQSTRSFHNISPAVSTSEFEGNTSSRKNNRLVDGKRGRRNEKDSEKSSEVVHVRAKRGQATDSHSIAERIRREKINEKMKCLQDLVPGCHKAKGMALMLDEIINYVHSLQNQVEFLSMELAVASSSYGLKTQGTSTEVAPGMEKWMKGRCGERNFHFDSTFGSYKYNKS